MESRYSSPARSSPDSTSASVASLQYATFTAWVSVNSAQCLDNTGEACLSSSPRGGNGCSSFTSWGGVKPRSHVSRGRCGELQHANCEGSHWNASSQCEGWLRRVRVGFLGFSLTRLPLAPVTISLVSLSLLVSNAPYFRVAQEWEWLRVGE